MSNIKISTISLGFITILLIVMIIISMLEPDYSKDVHITEVCTSNKVCAYDDNGDYGADYIEIYNASNRDIDITGYVLSDGKKSCNIYDFKNTIIPASSAIIVWCSSGDDTSEYLPTYNIVDVHQTSFSLKEGEEVILYNKRREAIDSISIPNIPEGQVLSSNRDDLDVFFISDSTPYQVSEKAQIIREATLEEPKFSIEGGWYEEPIQIQISGPYEEIYYTVDGSEPTKNSLRYYGNILINDRSKEENVYSSIDDISLVNPYVPDYLVDKATVVKAIGYDGESYSNIATQTYFINLDQKDAYNELSVMEITMDPEDLFGYEHGIYCLGNVYGTRLEKYGKLPGKYDAYFYANFNKKGRGWERCAKIEYYDPNHERVFEQKVGVRIKGNGSKLFNQKSFNLYAREEYDGNSSFIYDFFGKQYNRIMLRNGGNRDLYSTKMRDVLNQSLVLDRDIGAQRATPCVVFLNGEYWGLYNLQETICDSYISENYCVDADNIVTIKNEEVSTECEASSSFDELISFADDNDLSINENYEYICERMDMQNYINYMAFQIYVANADSVSSNYSYWRSIYEDKGEYADCRWRWLLFDTDYSAGMVDDRTEYYTNSFTSSHQRNPLGANPDPLFSSLMNNKIFKERFVLSFMDMANYNFNYERVHTILSEMADEYKCGVIASQRRFRGDYKISSYTRDTYDGTYTDEYFDREIQVIDEFYQKRYPYIVGYMKEVLSLKGNVNEISVSSSNPNHCSIGINTIEEVECGWKGKYYSDYPIELRCDVDEGYEFVCWKANGKTVSKDKVLQYALNEDTIVSAIVMEKQ